MYKLMHILIPSNEDESFHVEFANRFMLAQDKRTKDG